MASSLLPLLLLLLLLDAATATADLIADTCKRTGVHNDLCLQTLSSDPKSKSSDAHGLAHIVLGIAAREAVSVGDHVARTLDQTKSDEEELMQCLHDCEEEYEDAVQQLEQSRVSMDEKEYHEVVMFVEAAMGDIKSCQEGCHKVPEHKNLLTGKNRHVSQLCSITLTLTKILQSNSHPRPQ